MGIAVDQNGNLYVANQGDNTIEKFNSSGQGTVFTSSGLNQPIGPAFDSGGNLYAANAGSSTIEKFNSSAQGTLFANSGLSNPVGIAFDSSGNLFMADSTLGKTVRCDSERLRRGAGNFRQ